MFFRVRGIENTPSAAGAIPIPIRIVDMMEPTEVENKTRKTYHKGGHKEPMLDSLRSLRG